MDKIYKFTFTADTENENLLKNTRDEVNELAGHTMKLSAQNFIKAAGNAGISINEDSADIILIGKIFNSIRRDIDFDIPSVKEDSVWKELFNNIYNFSKEKGAKDINEICADLIKTFSHMCGGALGEMIRSVYPECWEWKNIIREGEPSFILANSESGTYIDPCECACKYIVDFDEKGPLSLFIYSIIRSQMSELIKNNYIYISGQWNISTGKVDLEFKNPESDSVNKTLYI